MIELSYLASLAKWLSVCLQTKWLWVLVQLQSLNIRFRACLSKKFLDIQAILECGFNLKGTRDMTRTSSQMHRTDKYSEHIKSNAPYRQVLRTQLCHLASLTEWLSVCLRTKWLCVRVQLQSLKL